MLQAMLVLELVVAVVGHGVAMIVERTPAPVPWPYLTGALTLGLFPAFWLSRQKEPCWGAMLNAGVVMLFLAGCMHNGDDQLAKQGSLLVIGAPLIPAYNFIGATKTTAIAVGVVLLSGVLAWTSGMDIQHYTVVATTLVLYLAMIVGMAWASQADLQELEEASEARQELLTHISHELRTPLNGIMGLTDLTLATELSGEQRRYLGMVRSSATGLLHGINDLLDMAKARADTLTLVNTPFDPAVEARLVVESLQPQAEARGLSMELEMDALPEALKGDPVRLRQVLANLVGNAIKYTDEGSVTVTLDYSDSLILRVQDTGIGIEPERLPDIFDAFSQVSDNKHAAGGTGLGLAITAELVGRMEGTIEVESSPGKGTVFIVRLPLRVTDEPVGEESWSGPLHLRSLSTDDLSTAGVALVAEDNQVNRFLLQTLLTKQGWEVLLAEDGRRAVELAERADIVLMDVQMPELDGLEATRLIRASGSTVPIVALTAHATEHDREACLAAGMNAFLTKPLRIADVLDTIARVTA